MRGKNGGTCYTVCVCVCVSFAVRKHARASCPSVVGRLFYYYYLYKRNSIILLTRCARKRRAAATTTTTPFERRVERRGRECEKSVSLVVVYADRGKNARVRFIGTFRTTTTYSGAAGVAIANTRPGFVVVVRGRYDARVLHPPTPFDAYTRARARSPGTYLAARVYTALYGRAAVSLSLSLPVSLSLCLSVSLALRLSLSSAHSRRRRACPGPIRRSLSRPLARAHSSVRVREPTRVGASSSSSSSSPSSSCPQQKQKTQNRILVVNEI